MELGNPAGNGSGVDMGSKKDDRAGAEPEEIIPVEHLVLPEEEKQKRSGLR